MGAFKITTWGESHGPAIGVVVEGCPAGIALSTKDIQKEVDRRKPTDPSISTTRKEEDKIEILSGIFEGKTTGTPISILVHNKDTKPEDYDSLKDIFRPSHADLTYEMKYGTRDYRGGGRSSGRETISRVMAGAIAKKVLASFPSSRGMKIFGHTIQVGNIHAEKFEKSEIEKNPLRCADKKATEKMLKLVKKIREEGDSIGSIIEIVIENPPAELGEPVFDKLDADLAKAFMSIGAVKGVEIGAGFAVAEMKSSENNDQMRVNKKGEIEFLSNNAGGILGGISTGNTIVARLAIKPPPSIKKLQKTITTSGENTEISISGRHDTCLAPRIIPVAESMAAITILDHLLKAA